MGATDSTLGLAKTVETRLERNKDRASIEGVGGEYGFFGNKLFGGFQLFFLILIFLCTRFKNEISFVKKSP